MTLADACGWNTLEQVSTTYLTRALVGMHRNDPTEAERLLQLGLAAQPTRADRLPLTGMLATRVRLLTARRRLTPARRRLDELKHEIASWRPPELLER